MTTFRLALSLAASLLAASAMAQAPADPDDGAGMPRAATAAQRKAEHERIRHEREAVKAQQLKDEAQCYQRFAVDDCLRGVRAGVRDAEGRLRAREIELNDAERREKAADRLKAIEEKQRPVPAPSGGKSPEAVLRQPAPSQAQRDQEAALRAEQQRNRVQQQTSEQARRAADNAARAAQARARHAQTLKDAEERRARVEKSRADAAAQGRKPAAPLPAASDAR